MWYYPQVRVETGPMIHSKLVDGEKKQLENTTKVTPRPNLYKYDVILLFILLLHPPLCYDFEITTHSEKLRWAKKRERRTRGTAGKDARRVQQDNYRSNWAYHTSATLDLRPPQPAWKVKEINEMVTQIKKHTHTRKHKHTQRCKKSQCCQYKALSVPYLWQKYEGRRRKIWLEWATHEGGPVLSLGRESSVTKSNRARFAGEGHRPAALAGGEKLTTTQKKHRVPPNYSSTCEKQYIIGYHIEVLLLFTHILLLWYY